MTVASVATQVAYAGNGSTVTFSWPYAYVQAADLVVTIWDAAAGAAVATTLGGSGVGGYSVSGTQDSATLEYLSGTITFAAAPTSAQTVYVNRATAATQALALTPNGPVPLASIMAALDRAALVAQDGAATAAGLFARCLQAPVSDPPGIGVTLPAASSRAGRLLGFDGVGNASTYALTGSSIITQSWVYSVDPRSFGAVSDAQKAFTNVTMSSSAPNTLVVSTPIFAATDVGKVLATSRNDVWRGTTPWWATGAGGHVTITAYNSPYSVTVSAPLAASPGTGESWPPTATPYCIVWGTANATAVQTALNLALSLGAVIVEIAAGCAFCIEQSLILYNNSTLIVDGTLYACGTVSTATGGSSQLGPLLMNSYCATCAWNSSLTVANNARVWTLTGANNDITVAGRGWIDLSGGGGRLAFSAGQFYGVQRLEIGWVRVLSLQNQGGDCWEAVGCAKVARHDLYMDGVTAGCDTWGGWEDVSDWQNIIVLAYGQFANPVGCQYNAEWQFGALATTVATMTCQRFRCHRNTILVRGASSSANAPIAVNVVPLGGPDGVIIGGKIDHNVVDLADDALNNLITDDIYVGGGVVDVAVHDNSIGPLSAHVPGVEDFGYLTGVASGAGGGNFTISSVSGVSGASTVTLTTSAHGMTFANIGIVQPYAYAFSGPVIGGQTLSGVYQIDAATGTSFTLALPSGTLSSSGTVSWTGSVTVGGIANNVRWERNVFRDPVSTDAVIYVKNGQNTRITDNSVIVSPGSTAQYMALVHIEGIGDGSCPGIVRDNTGPAGTVALTSGLSGNHDVCWGLRSGTPLVLDAQLASGLWVVTGGSLTV